MFSVGSKKHNLIQYFKTYDCIILKSHQSTWLGNTGTHQVEWAVSVGKVQCGQAVRLAEEVVKILHRQEREREREGETDKHQREKWNFPGDMIHCRLKPRNCLCYVSLSGHPHEVEIYSWQERWGHLWVTAMFYLNKDRCFRCSLSVSRMKTNK